MLYLFLLPCILLHTAFGGCRVLAPLFALHLGASAFTVGIIMSLLGLLPMIFSISAGRWIDRIGVRKPMLLGTFTVTAGLLLAVAVPRLEILFLVSPLVGSGFVLFHIAVNHAAGTISLPQDRAKNFSLLALTFSASGFLGPMIAGFAIDWIGYRHTFLLLATSAILTLIVLLVKKLDTPKREPAETRGVPHHFTDLLRDHTMRRVFIVSSSLAIAWDLFVFVVPIHGSRIGLTASQIGLILGAFGVAIFVLRLILPWFVHRVSAWQMLTTAMMATGITFFVFPLVHSMPVLIFLAFILGVGLGGAQPMIMTLLFTHAPAGRGAEAVGVRTLLLNVSQTGMPLVFGTLGAAMGMTPVFWTMAFALAGTGYWLRKR
jgi:MFS family permease